MAQYDEDRRKERAIYYLSKKMTDYETWYTGENLLGFGLGNAEIEALHAVLTGTFNSSHGPQNLFEKAALTGRTARWLLLLSEFDITYVTQKFIKGRAIAEHLAEHPIKEEDEFKDCFPDEEIAVTEEEGRAWK